MTIAPPAIALLPVVLAAALGGAALAAPAGSDLARWLSENTDIPAAQVVIAGPEHIYSLEPLGPRTATGEVIALVRTEPLAADWGATHSFQSWEAHLLFDCGKGRFRQIRVATYPERNRRGPPTVEDVREGWTLPKPDQPVMQLLSAACDSAFAWPLRPSLVSSAATLPAAAPVAPPTAGPAAEAPPVIEAVVPGPAKRATPAPAQISVQIARGPSEAGAQQALARARKDLGAAGEALNGRTEMAQLGSRRRYTAILEGFSSTAAAVQACKQLNSQGQDCFVRKASEADAAEAAPPAEPSTPPPASAESPTSGSLNASAPAPPLQPGAHVVQVARGPSEAGAKRALAAAQKALGPSGQSLTARTEMAQLGRRVRYTALLGGFPTAAAATEACKALQEAGQTCFTRSSASGQE